MTKMIGTFHSAAVSLAVAAVVNSEDYGVYWDGSGTSRL